MSPDFARDYYEAVYDVEPLRALAAVDRAVDAGWTPEDIVFDMVIPGIDRMLRSFLERKEATLSQHYLAARISEQVIDRMLPLFRRTYEYGGTIVLGTPPGDFHGLGKKIVGGCLKAHLYSVIDLGVNVRPERFVDEAVSSGAHVIGVSSMMVHTTIGEFGARAVRRILEERGLEHSVKLIVGGAAYQFDPSLAEQVEADAWAPDALQAVQTAGLLFREAGNVPV